MPDPSNMSVEVFDKVKAEAARNGTIKKMDGVGIDLTGKTPKNRSRNQWRVADPAMDPMGWESGIRSARSEEYFRSQDRVVNALLDDLPDYFFDGKGELKGEADGFVRMVVDNQVTGYRSYDRFRDEDEQCLIRLGKTDPNERLEAKKEVEIVVDNLFSKVVEVPEAIVIEGDFTEEPKYYSNIRIDLETARNGYKGLRGEDAKQGREAIRKRLEEAGIEFDDRGRPIDPGDIEHQKPEWIGEQIKRQARGEKAEPPIKEVKIDTDDKKDESNGREGVDKSPADAARELYQRAMRIPTTNANGRMARNALLMQVIGAGGDIPQDLINRAVAGLNYPDVTPAAPEAKEVMGLDDLRAEFHMVMNEQLFSKNGSVDPVTEIFVNQWLNDRGLSGVQNKRTRDEFLKYMTLMNMRAASRHFEDNPSILSKVIGKEGIESGQGEDLDTKWKRAYLAGYQDRQILGVLENQETDGFKQDNVSLALKAFAENVIAARSGALDNTLSEWALFYRANEPAKPEFELSYIAAIAEELGITEYEASVGYSMFEALLEPEYNTRHPLYSITHPQEHATALRFSIWWGSSAWWNPEITGDPTGQACAMPDRLWAPAGIMYPDLRAQILAGNGVDEILDIFENPAKTGQGILTKNFGDIAKAVNLHKLFTDVGPGTPGGKMDANILWKIKDLTSVLMVPIDDITNKKMNYYNAGQAVENLLSVAKVFFWEISVRNPNYRNDEDRGILRAVSPKGMFDRFVTLSTKRDGFAFFEFKGAIGPLSTKMRSSHGVVRSYVSGIIRDFFSANPAIPLPEGEKTVTSSVLDSLPEQPIDDRGVADKTLMSKAGNVDVLSQIAGAAYSRKRNTIADLERSAATDSNPVTKLLKKAGTAYLKS